MCDHLTMTYTNNVAGFVFGKETGSFRYRVIERGSDFVVIANKVWLSSDHDMWLRFADGGKSYWLHSREVGLDMRFDKIEEK